MFSYYGSKSKLARKYPPPGHERIIEPFCGSARYSLEWYGRDVWINDVDPVIWEIWDWIVNKATVGDVENLPEPAEGENLNDLVCLSQVERNLLSFSAGVGSGQCFTVTKWAFRDRKIATLKKKLFYYLPRVKHWRVTNCSFEQILVNPEATWFVDPPYQGLAGRYYTYNDIDYGGLANWCLSRRGQVMVCEGAEANWLAFRVLRAGCNGINNQKSTEMIWTRLCE